MFMTPGHRSRHVCLQVAKMAKAKIRKIVKQYRDFGVTEGFLLLLYPANHLATPLISLATPCGGVPTPMLESIVVGETMSVWNTLNIQINSREVDYAAEWFEKFL